MNILAILQAVLAAAPQLLALYDRQKSGQPVTEADLTAALSGLDSDIAQAFIDYAKMP